ncbi:hypothetical protein PLESTM_001461100 [Pleodorina starrii]|nr:hypothetical protein PLESTM_001110400 [Pleodorina starrii]GLC43344.1 hypothetical protein PLESTM_001461100 [Pleodorina starrii]
MGKDDRFELKFGPGNYVVVALVVEGELERKGVASAISSNAAARKDVTEVIDMKARGIIKGYLTFEDLTRLVGKKTAYELWMGIKDFYGQADQARASRLKTAFYGYIMEGGEDIPAYFLRFRTLRHEMMNAGIAVDEEEEKPPTRHLVAAVVNHVKNLAVPAHRRLVA